MALDFKNKVDSLLNVAIPTFGETVTYYPVGKGDYKLTAVFDRNFEMIDPETEAVISSNVPRLGVNLNNMHEKPREGDLVRIVDELFRVEDSQEDGQGGATLQLVKIDKADERRAFENQKGLCCTA